MIKIEENSLEKELLDKYMELVLKTNESFNLTSITDKEEFYNRHFYDSLSIVSYFDYENKKVMDLGSGAGFPGIPLAIYLKNTMFYLVEPIKKRSDFLSFVVKELGLKNVIVLNKRSEDLEKEYRNYFDFVVSRAVSNLSILLELSIPFLKIDGHLIAYKGNKYKEEIENSKNALKILNSRIVEIKEENINNAGKTYNIVIKKEKEVDSKYPRKYSKIKNNTL